MLPGPHLTLCAEIALAFQELEWKQRFRLQHGFQNPHTSPFRIDRSRAVFERNRYSNVQPWDASRIRLNNPIGGSDYVNASPITLKSRITSKSHSGTSTPVPVQVESRYIATQGPKEGQYSHFWHMVMQETPGDVGIVIMLTQHVEGNKEKCAQYYPVDKDNATMTLSAHEDEESDEGLEPTADGDPFLDISAISADADGVGTDSEASQIPDAEPDDTESREQGKSGSVTLVSMHHDSRTGCEVRKLHLTIGNESKMIYHYFFNSWPDFGKPEAEDRTALLELTRVSKAVAGDAPRVVHCSAGVGRTGTWIALDFLLQELDAGLLVESLPSSGSSQAELSKGTWGKSGPPKASTPELKDEDDLIWETVNTLREQRMMMVMNELQYSFIYEALKEAFVDKYAEKETGPIVIEVQEPSPKVARKRSPSAFGRIFHGTKVGSVKRDEDTVSDKDAESEGSEAETEVMDHERGGVDVNIDDKIPGGKQNSAVAAAAGEDQYSAVAPETILEQQKKEA